jgi:[ribosomal protein S5]-alanine N-acetyltransferase
MLTRLEIDSELYLSVLDQNDAPALALYLNEKEIHDRTLQIPFPYSEADAHWFISHCEQLQQEHGHVINWAIRLKTGELIGGIGFHCKNMGSPIAHRDEVGYWVAKPYWNKGIMSRVLPLVCAYGRDVRGLRRIEAPIYAWNIGSEKVLLKSGFRQEGYLCKSYFKNNTFHDAKLFALIY